jgi:hypothetical protein
MHKIQNGVHGLFLKMSEPHHLTLPVPERINMMRQWTIDITH